MSLKHAVIAAFFSMFCGFLGGIIVGNDWATPVTLELACKAAYARILDLEFR